MTQLSTSQLFAAAVYFLPTLVWAAVSVDLWSFCLRLRPQNWQSRLLPWLTTLATCIFAVATVFTLLPLELHERRPPLLVAFYNLQDIIIILALALTRHLTMLGRPGAQPPSRRWLVMHYGLAAAIIALTIDPFVLPALASRSQLHLMRIIHFTYIIAMMALSVATISRFARRGLWRPGALGEMRTVPEPTSTWPPVARIDPSSRAMREGELPKIRNPDAPAKPVPAWY